MPNTVTKQKIADNTRNAIVHVFITGDGSGEESDTVVVDASDLFGAPTNVKLLRVQSTLANFSATLEWDATTDIPFMEIPANTDIDRDWSYFGGLINNAGSGVTGDISITTSSLGNGDKGHITFWVAKS